jgi:uncharacterized protein YjbJ (UPF0337 family)
MSNENLKQRTAGTAEKFIGRVMRFFGRLFGSHRVELEGTAEELRGHADVAGGKVGEQIHGVTKQGGEAIEDKARDLRTAAEEGKRKLEERARH